MKLEPVITEKSLNLAQKGKYTFRVEMGMNKHKIKKLIEDTFEVRVESVNTINEPGEKKTTLLGRKKVIKPGKKAIVSLKEKDKIDLFEEASE